MIKFTLAKDSLPFSFFEEVDFSYQDIAKDCIKRKFPGLRESKYEDIFEEHEVDFQEILYELRNSNSLNDCWIGDNDVDEATGTWGYSDYEVNDIKNVRLQLEEEVRILMEEIVKEIVL